MEPLNQAERRKAFTNFLIFFIVTVVIIVAAVFFSIQVPFRQNDQLRDQMNVVEKERDFSETFANKMGETINLLDSINKKEVQSPELVDNKIQLNITALNEMIEKDPVAQKTIYKYIVNTFDELRRAKKDLRDVSGKDANLSNLQKENAELRNNYQQALDRYAQLQQLYFQQRK
jgi:Tfp pilus assembly protein PilO